VTYELSNGGRIVYFAHDVCGEEFSFSDGQDLDQMQAVFDDHEAECPGDPYDRPPILRPRKPPLQPE
jgi:hypothetical protein